MKTTTHKLLLSAALGVTGLMIAGCKSTPSEAQAPSEADAATTPANLSLPAGQANAVKAEGQSSSSTGDPYGDRAAPFSKEGVEALESQLKALDNIPVPKEALPPPKAK